MFDAKMRKLFLVLAIASFIGASSANNDPNEEYVERSVNVLYNEAVNAL